MVRRLELEADRAVVRPRPEAHRRLAEEGVRDLDRHARPVREVQRRVDVDDEPRLSPRRAVEDPLDHVEDRAVLEVDLHPPADAAVDLVAPVRRLAEVPLALKLELERHLEVADRRDRLLDDPANDDANFGFLAFSVCYLRLSAASGSFLVPPGSLRRRRVRTISSPRRARGVWPLRVPDFSPAFPADCPHRRIFTGSRLVPSDARGFPHIAAFARRSHPRRGLSGNPLRHLYILSFLR